MKQAAVIFLVFLNYLAWLLLLAWPLVAFGAMFFGGPQMQTNWLYQAIFLQVMAFPLTAGLGGYRALRAYSSGDYVLMAKYSAISVGIPLALTAAWLITR